MLNSSVHELLTANMSTETLVMYLMFLGEIYEKKYSPNSNNDFSYVLSAFKTKASGSMVSRFNVIIIVTLTDLTAYLLIGIHYILHNIESSMLL